MRFDLRTTCKNCPFRTDATAIRFSCRERAEEIAESAYRNGFPCHLSADLIEDDDYSDGGFVFGDNTQHCAGALMMFAPDLDGTLAFQHELTDAEQERVIARLDWKAPVFECEDAFLASYGAEEECP